MKPILELRNISYKYSDHDDKFALQGFNVSLHEGKKIAVVGRNGSGKSTFFLHCNGLYRPQSGQVLLRGEPLAYDRKSLQRLRQQVGLIFQNPDDQLFSASVTQDIGFGPLNLGLDEGEVRRRIAETAAVCEITHLLERPTHALSGREKTRVALGGVLAMRPSLLVADELINALDPWARQQVFGILDRIVDEGKTVLLATHDMDVAFGWGERVIWMEEGRVRLDGTSKEVQAVFDAENPAFAGHVPPRF